LRKWRISKVGVIKLHLFITTVSVFAAGAMTVDGAMLVMVMRAVVRSGVAVGHVSRRGGRATVLTGIEIECECSRWRLEGIDDR
jgi:hypothetical protein